MSAIRNQPTNIRAQIESVSAEELVKVNNNFIKRRQQYLAHEGGHLQHQM